MALIYKKLEGGSGSGKDGTSMRAATIASNNSTTMSNAHIIPVEGRSLIVGDLILYTDGVVKIVTAVTESGNSAAVSDTGINLKPTLPNASGVSF